MNRRQFGILSASTLLASRAGSAQAAGADQAALLKTTLTPLGAERAGNADGSIPAWTGGYTTIPTGWTPDQLMPDFFAGEAATLTINAANMDQYKSRLSDGVMALMRKSGFSINVFPTHRTASAPQWVYDNTYQNAMNAKPADQGIRHGFTGAYGGIPFPIPDSDDNAGGEIIWNHLCRWFGEAYNARESSFIVNNGQATLVATAEIFQNLDYYDPKGNLATFNGYLSKTRLNYKAPPAFDGEDLIQYIPTNSEQLQQVSWQLVLGQGRVRKSPELKYDTPAQNFDGVGNYDEYFGFFGQPDRYNWTSLGKREMYIPYNNNGIYLKNPMDILGPHFIDPAVVRWELHRVWVVDATLASGERNVIPHRRFYIDEDTWTIGLNDVWDGNGNLWRANMNFNNVRPDMPGTIYATNALFNLQTGQYVIAPTPWANGTYGGFLNFTRNQGNLYDPRLLAAQSQF